MGNYSWTYSSLELLPDIYVVIQLQVFHWCSLTADYELEKNQGV